MIDFDGRLVTYDVGELDEVASAYAATVHKSQGSEYPVVVIPLATQHYPMLARQSPLYGVTRGKQFVVVIGQPRRIDCRPECAGAPTVDESGGAVQAIPAPPHTVPRRPVSLPTRARSACCGCRDRRGIRQPPSEPCNVCNSSATRGNNHTVAPVARGTVFLHCTWCRSC